MIGTEVESRPPGWFGVILFVVAGLLGLVGSVVAGESGLAVFAALPFALAAALALSTEPPVRFAVTADGLAFETPEVGLIRYADIQGLTTPGRGGDGDVFAIQIYHPGGVVRVPSRLTATPRDIYRFVLSQLPDADPPGVDIPPALRPFAAEQMGLFGPDKVYIFVARYHPPVAGYRRRVAISLGVAAAGVVWIVAGVALGKGGEPWIGFGALLTFFGLLLAFAFHRQSVSGRVANWRESGLVVSPGGIALVQGTLRGRMRWDELRAIDFPAKSQHGLVTSREARIGIGLKVDGAYLVLADYYTRPLARIHSHIRAYWGGADAN